MIAVTYDNPNKVTSFAKVATIHAHGDAFVLPRATRLNITIDEWRRRDDVVQTLYKESKLKFGDTVYPATMSDYKEHGQCFVTHITKGYAEMDSSDDKWPKNDNPMIVALRSSNPESPFKGQLFLCTTNWLSKTAPTK